MAGVSQNYWSYWLYSLLWRFNHRQGLDPHCCSLLCWADTCYYACGGWGIKLNNFENEEEPRNVDQIIGHPNYASATITNDACLLKLKESLEWTDFVKPIALPAAGQDTQAGTECTVTGWGTLR